MIAEAIFLRRALHGFETFRTLDAMAQMISAAAVLAVVSYLSWIWLDDALGRSLPAQIVSLGTALALGGAAYGGIVLAWGIPEARQIFDLFARRLRKRS